MAQKKTQNISETEILCLTLDDLIASMHAVDDLPDDAEVEIIIQIELPGIGKRAIRLLDEVPVKVKWRTIAEEF